MEKMYFLSKRIYFINFWMSFINLVYFFNNFTQSQATQIFGNLKSLKNHSPPKFQKMEWNPRFHDEAFLVNNGNKKAATFTVKSESLTENSFHSVRHLWIETTPGVGVLTIKIVQRKNILDAINLFKKKYNVRIETTGKEKYICPITAELYTTIEVVNHEAQPHSVHVLTGSDLKEKSIIVRTLDLENDFFIITRENGDNCIKIKSRMNEHDESRFICRWKSSSNKRDWIGFDKKTDLNKLPRTEIKNQPYTKPDFTNQPSGNPSKKNKPSEDSDPKEKRIKNSEESKFIELKFPHKIEKNKSDFILEYMLLSLT
ncbi:hypothetical protein BY996DRAFT_1796547 [Phakopsora pachyrhizi]|uniref:Expressed protein n=1 Tax=Phakopsora pachyrhizi TaxID=170000 RepID=A0AAV0BGB4_PHAPC|nr:hypothetical protein BY996DRAFT_1796547 [Phakopsora pachyrhizi]CAH7685435.1 expressed protein [Phakopsora pachyrhizi]